MEGQQASSSNDLSSSFDKANVPNLSELDQDERALVSHIKKHLTQLNHIRSEKLRTTSLLNNDNPNNSKQVAFLNSQTELFKNLIEVIEFGDTQGFVYGIITGKGKTVSDASENLRNWWENIVQFGYNAPQAITRYTLDNFTSSPFVEKPPINIRERLSEISDPTLSSLVSALMQHCNPPQKHHPFETGVAPPWWPTLNEPWWEALGFSDADKPSYKKPHDLKKACKVAVLTAILYHLFPNTNHIRALVWHSRSLQEKMTSKDNVAWLSVLDHLDREYLAVHSQARSPRPLDITGSNSYNMSNFACMGDAQFINHQSFMPFTCANVGCPHHRVENGFADQSVRNAHQISCPYNLQLFGSNQMNAGNLVYDDYNSFVNHPNAIRNVRNDSMTVNLQGYPEINMMNNVVIHDQAGTSNGGLQNLQIAEPDMTLGDLDGWFQQNF